MKTAICYYSHHHGNTRRVVEAMAQTEELDLIDVSGGQTPRLEDYDRIGFASGIYFFKFHKSVLEFAKQNLPPKKSVFFLYTCGAPKDSYTKSMEAVVQEKSAQIKGTLGCLGYDTFGPFQLIGGIAKGHPDETDCRNAVAFFERLHQA